MKFNSETKNMSKSSISSNASLAIQYDVIVIGAGIQGAGIAQASAANGLKTLVLEQYPEAALGTSSKSSKLIHGGLRYLESFSVSLVKECLDERALLLKNAPGLVKRNRFYIPVYTSSKRHWLIIYIGLWLYAWLSGDFLGQKIGRLKPFLFSGLDGLKSDGLVAVLFYEDAQTDDKLLTEAVIKSYESLGGSVEYNACVQDVDYAKNIFTVTTKGENGNSPQIFRSAALINAAGPWVNRVAEMMSPKPETMTIDLVQGTHIVIDRKISDTCFYGESPDDGRAVFVLPWKGKSMVGTTEKILTDGPESVGATPEEIDYLLRVVNFYFPAENVVEDSITDVFAGSRVLPVSDTAASKRSRRWW